jgi:hypothetical protein
MSDWPAPTEYTIAVQNPHVCFRDPDLRAATVQRTAATGMPKVWTGNFAQVYELRTATGRWAVKCFTRSVADIQARYARIAAAIAKSRLPYFVDFECLDREMLVNGARWPVLKMRWSEGQPLDLFVEANLARPRALLSTASRLFVLVKDLERRKLAHGDLQHGNIMIGESGVELVDYDGMFVPAFAGTGAPEGGLASYQHPNRSTDDYAVGLDRFSVLVIGTALYALSVDPSLWAEFGARDNLLFTGDDFKDPAASRLMQRLGTLEDPQLHTLVRSLTAACASRPLEVSLPARPIAGTPIARHRFWWVSSPAPDAPPPSQPATPAEIAVERTVSPLRSVGAALRARLHPAALAVQRTLNRKYRIRVMLRSR